MNFYVVNNNMFENNGFAYGEKRDKANTGSAIKCDECGSFLTGLEWLQPMEIKLSKGKLGDVIFGTFSHFIVSERFKEIYDKNSFRGVLSFDPVTMYRKEKQTSDRYYYPRIVLSEVHFDIKKSGIVLDGMKQCSSCQKAGRIIKKVNGLYFSDEEKIKEDIFCTKMLPGDIVFSKLFKEAAKDLLNLSFIDAKQYVPSWVI